MQNQINAQIEEAVRELGEAIGLQPGFYERLLEEPSDWAFIIHLQIIAEAAIAQALVKALKNERAFDHVSRLNFGGTTGKLQLAKALGILGSGSVEALRALSACRNAFAHRISSIGTTMETFGESLDANTKLDLMRNMALLEPSEESAERAAGFPDFGANLRYRLWLSTARAMGELASAPVHARLVELQRQLERETRRPRLDTSKTASLALPVATKSDEKP
jgi:hypothetical protein